MRSSRRRTSWWLATNLRLAWPLLVLAATLLPYAAFGQDAVRVYSGGRRRTAFLTGSDRLTAQYSISVRLEFGASGLLRERLERGEAADVFASANMEHPATLAKNGKSGPVVLFARNELCALVREGLAVT